MPDIQQKNRRNIRIDRGIPLPYPASPDASGRARFSLNRKSFYFGKHGTPESHAAFALWVIMLERDGEPTAPAKLKVAVASFLNGGAKRNWLMIALILAFASIASASIIGLCLVYSRGQDTWVDGVAMTARETSHIRTMRSVDTLQIDNFDESRVAEIFDKVSKEGIPDAPPPRLSAKPPVPPLD